MAFCNKCGAEIPEGANVCPACGEPVKTAADAAQNTAQSTAQNVAQNIFNLNDSTAEFDSSDIENNKVLALFSYLFFLFLVPLFAAPDSKFAKFHANQGLVLFLIEVAYMVIMTIFAFIPFVGWILAGIVGGILGLIILAYMVLGIINAVNGKAIELPIIGMIKIIK